MNAYIAGVYDLYLFLEQSIEQRKTMSEDLFGGFVDRLSLPPELVETFKDAFEVATTLTRYAACIPVFCVFLRSSLCVFMYTAQLYRSPAEHRLLRPARI